MRRMKPSPWFGLLAMLVAPNAGLAQELTVTGRVMLDPAAHGKHADNSNAVVWLAPLPGSAKVEWSPPPSPHRFRLVQKDKRFTPHILVVPAGSVVEFPNLDPFFHNVFSLFEGKRFDLGLYEAGATRTVNFNAPGICYVFCNIHAEMSAVVLVVKTHYYGASNRSGELTIPNVPPGRYELHVWHERCLPEVLKLLTREVTLTENSHFLGNIRLTESGDLLSAHKNKYGRDYDRPSPPSPLYEQP